MKRIEREQVPKVPKMTEVSKVDRRQNTKEWSAGVMEWWV